MSIVGRWIFTASVAAVTGLAAWSGLKVLQQASRPKEENQEEESDSTPSSPSPRGSGLGRLSRSRKSVLSRLPPAYANMLVRGTMEVVNTELGCAVACEHLTSDMALESDPQLRS